MARVILDASAGPDLEHHLDVEIGARLESLRFEQLVRCAQIRQSLHQLLANEGNRALDGRPRCHEMLGGIDRGLLQIRDRISSQRINLADPLYLVAPHLDAHALLLVGRQNFDRIAAHPERPALQSHVVARVLDLHQRTENVVAGDLLAFGQRHHLLAVAARISQPVNRRHRRHDDDVVALHQARGRAQTQPVDVLVDRRILFDVRIGGRDVRFRLIVVVVRDEVLDCVVREEALQFPIELSG